MKSLSIYAVFIISIFASSQSFAQKNVANDTIKVWGNCGMCQKTIEKSAKAAGASSANWNEDTKLLTVSYKSKKTSLAQIQQSIAKAGYDTQDFTADSSAYYGLHGCCQYERKNLAATEAARKDCCNNNQCCNEVKACTDMASCKNKVCCKL